MLGNVSALFGPLGNHLIEKSVDFVHLAAVPVNFGLGIAASILEKPAGFKHVSILLHVQGRLSFADVAHLVFKVTALVLKNLVCVLFTARHPLEFGKIFSIGKSCLNAGMLVLESLEFGSDLLNQEAPCIVK